MRYLKFFELDTLTSKSSLKYLKREIQILLRSKNTPHITPFIQYGSYNNFLIFAFDYCNGGSLQKVAESRGINLSANLLGLNQRFTFNEIKIVAKSLIEFIDDMHGRNFLHRSINPKHILVIMEKNMITKIKVGGLKSAKSANVIAESLVPAIETIRFADPLAVEEGFCENSDLWSIGMVIYFMTFGKLPANKFPEFLEIRNRGTIAFPNTSDYPNLKIDESINFFIQFCIAKRKMGELSQIVLVDLLKKSIPWFN